MANTLQSTSAQQEGSFIINLSGWAGDSIVDGPGLRVTLFCQGCPHGCAGCHNPATHPFVKKNHKTIEEAMALITRFPLCHAVTFSGGEPFCQPKPLAVLAQQLKQKGYELAAYTGFTFEKIVAMGGAELRFLSLLDTLIDGPFVFSRRSLSLPFRGSDNQRILNVQASLEKGSPQLETALRWNGL